MKRTEEEVQLYDTGAEGLIAGSETREQITPRKEVETIVNWDVVLKNLKLAQSIVDYHLNNGNSDNALEALYTLTENNSQFTDHMLLLGHAVNTFRITNPLNAIIYFNTEMAHPSYMAPLPQTLHARFHPKRPIAPEDDVNNEGLTTSRVEGKLQIQEKDGRYLLCISEVPVENIIAMSDYDGGIWSQQVAGGLSRSSLENLAEGGEAEASTEQLEQEKPIDPEKYLADLKKLQEDARLTFDLYKFDEHIPRDKRIQYQIKVDQVCALFNDEENRLKQVSFKTKLLELNGLDETVYDGHFQPKRLGFTNLVGVTVINAILHYTGTEIMEMVQIHYPNLEESEDENRKYYIPVDTIKKIVVEVAR